MKASTTFALLIGVASGVIGFAGCTTSGPAPQSISQPPLPTATPAANYLYVNHNGKFFVYHLPLEAGAKPVLTLTEWPGLPLPPVITADQYGNVTLASTSQLRIFHAPITSLDPSHAKLVIPLTPAITEIGQFGADLVDMEYDPNENLWLFNDLGAEISELRAPLSRNMVASLTIGFGAPGSKTAGFTGLVQGRFDVNATLYVYATSSTQARLFKIPFPYAAPPGNEGINLEEADFIDTSQWPPTAPNAPSLLLGQYTGDLHSPPPGIPPSPPVDEMSQFPQPFIPSIGRFPDASSNVIVGALIADPYRYSFYALDGDDGALTVYGLPMQPNAAPKITIKCIGGPAYCDEKPENLYLAP
ncbi:MAG TPA: hypothetical protein VFF63_04450 [Candidatus Babeliales bacterium]|nr:hypothetical protein [Candidatus Babeliales bacterium]